MGEAYITRRGGGGNPLNFKVVGGNTAPSTPSENTIWVNTHVGITSWYFGADEPNYHEEGTVWISTDTASPTTFNALKKNGITVYPISAKQYISGAWVDKPAKSYQNSAWVDWWNGELYKNGDEYERITGGWTQCYSSGGSVTKTDTGMVLKYSASNGGSGIGYATEKKIDLTNVQQIVFAFSNYTATNKGTFGVAIKDSRPTDNSAFGNNAIVQAWNDAKNTSLTVDVSNVSGEYYVCFTVKAGYESGKTHTVDATIVEVQME